MFTGPSAFPQQECFLRVACVPCDQTCADRGHSPSFCPEAPVWCLSLECFLFFLWREHSLGDSWWPAGLTFVSVLPFSVSLSTLMLCVWASPVSVPGCRVGGRGQASFLAVLALPHICCICLPHFLQLCPPPPHLGVGERKERMSTMHLNNLLWI